MSRILVAYHCVSGNTEMMAKEVVRGVSENGVDAEINEAVNIDKFPEL